MEDALLEDGPLVGHLGEVHTAERRPEVLLTGDVLAVPVRLAYAVLGRWRLRPVPAVGHPAQPCPPRRPTRAATCTGLHVRLRLPGPPTRRAADAAAPGVAADRPAESPPTTTSRFLAPLMADSLSSRRTRRPVIAQNPAPCHRAGPGGLSSRRRVLRPQLLHGAGGGSQLGRCLRDGPAAGGPVDGQGGPAVAVLTGEVQRRGVVLHAAAMGRVAR